MPGIWWIVPGLAALLGALLLIGVFGSLFRGKFFRAVRGLAGGGFFLAIAAAISLLALNIQSYARLAWEQPVADVTITKTGERAFDVTVTEAGRPAHTYALTGDQWQMDARIIAWKPWANILGLDTQFELQRLWGRHLSGEQRNTAAAQDLLIERPGIDVLALSHSLGNWAPFSQREFGSAVYMPLADGAQYEVRISQKALVVDPVNPIAKQAVAQGALGETAPPAPDAETAGAGEGLRITLPWSAQ